MISWSAIPADGLLGGAGNDILIGGLGNDILSGGAGKDTFQFLETSGGHANFGKDIIVDFEFGQDKIDIRAPGFTISPRCSIRPWATIATAMP